MSTEKIIDNPIKREPGYLYFIDKAGDVSRNYMSGQIPLFCEGKFIANIKRRPEKVTTYGIKREPGWLYYIDKDGYVCRCKMARGGRN